MNFPLVPRWNSRLPHAPKEDKRMRHVVVIPTSEDDKPDPDARQIR